MQLNVIVLSAHNRFQKSKISSASILCCKRIICIDDRMWIITVEAGAWKTAHLNDSERDSRDALQITVII